ncbi:restriction endonuclease subunit S [Polaribacter litorisediminis]|uniref:restriction endonuclease subunit S n=1 Tax=Polaribacter litorisediminis TaxID=1908341 RepID=UPI001CBC0AF8|nr:restriction endonuclease subunit S [Polaribacter litorisediminis]UAM97444.1 restriction endonuclease subunit S [Polaribacter litorisediminis]
MRNKYRKIGDFIEKVNIKNNEGIYLNLQGINIDKFFMPSVANTVGVDLKKYKIIKKGQFACNRMHVGRDYRIPIALSKDETPFIVSPAYDVFQIKDETQLAPEYLMMWFSRKEFDRNAWFYTDADVRGGLPWVSLINIELPVPSIEKQREIVKEYNTIVNRIKLNETLNQKLEDTAQALYKHWFVDFNFPITKESCPELVSGSPELEGKPYKSSGGEMVFNEELDVEIPVGWEKGVFGDVVETINGFAFKSFDFSSEGDYPILKIKNIQPPLVSIDESQFYNNILNDKLKRVIIEKGDTLITMTGSGANQINSAVGQVGRYYFNTPSLLNQRVCKLLPKYNQVKQFAYLFISQEEKHLELLAGSSGSANQANISPDQIKNLRIVLPKEKVLIAFESKISLLFNYKSVQQQIYLQKFKDLILSKMSKLETKAAVV